MKWFNRDKEDYPLTAEEDAKGKASGIAMLLYAVLFGVVIITAAHAVMLVLATTGDFAASDDGLFYALLNVIRVAFPIIVEIAAVGVGLGFIRARWRAGQRGIGGGLEAAWFVFAAANMITFFAIERGDELQGWQSWWVQIGLPMSALVVAAMTYKLLKADPNHKRANEEALAAEKKTAAEHKARHGVMTSDAMMTIYERRTWRETVNDLAAQGYDEEEIAFMTSHIPALQALAAQRDAPAAPPTEEQHDAGLLAQALGFLRGKRDDADMPTVVMSNSTHGPDAPRQAPTAAPGQGAGNGPAAKPLGGSSAKDFR